MRHLPLRRIPFWIAWSVTGFSSLAIANADRGGEWAGFDLSDGSWVDTGDWLGLVDVAEAPWIYSSGFGSWLFLDGDHVTDQGGWAFVLAKGRETIPQERPYPVPEIKGPGDFSDIVYIDPSGSHGDGSMVSPYNTLAGLTLQPDTAYLLKRGTVLSERPNKVWIDTYVGAYGEGAMPIIDGGLRIRRGSRDATFVGLDIRRTGRGERTILRFAHPNDFDDTSGPIPSHITVAFCNIQGFYDNGYPQYNIEHSADFLVFYNNRVSYSQNNGWWLTSTESVQIIRNWFHHQNMGGVEATDSTGDTIQVEYELNRGYFAGNHMDKSHAMWKYTLMFNIPLGSPATKNIVVEYNTFYAPKRGAGGAAVRWVAGGDSTFRRNVINSIGLVTPIDTWPGHAAQPYPYGIRDNHILADPGSSIATNGSVLDESNQIFRSQREYDAYRLGLTGQFGSDIDTSDPEGFFSEAPE